MRNVFFFFFSFHLRNGKTRKMHCVCICGLPWNAPFVWLVNPPLLLYCNTVHASSQFIFNVRGTAGVPSLFTRILCLQHKIKKKKKLQKVHGPVCPGILKVDVFHTVFHHINTRNNIFNHFVLYTYVYAFERCFYTKQLALLLSCTYLSVHPFPEQYNPWLTV